MDALPDVTLLIYPGLETALKLRPLNGTQTQAMAVCESCMLAVSLLATSLPGKRIKTLGCHF